MDYAQMHLPVVAPPLEGECLGSWIGRIATNYAVSVTTLLRTIGLATPSHYSKNWLLLQPLNKSDWLLVAKACRRSQESIVSMVPSVWHITRQGEFGICARCLGEDKENGRPMYWRRSWLNAVNVLCDRHECWLTPIDAGIFWRFKNWDGIERALLDMAETAIDCQRRGNAVLDRLNKSSAFLQLLFKDDTANQIAQSRYGFVDAESAQQVAIDLLDALIHVSPSERRYSALHEYAWYLRIPIDNQDLSINIIPTCQMNLRRVQTLETRAFAITVADAIMFARAPADAQRTTERLIENRAFWMNSLWTFLPKCGVELLYQRAKNWPLNYAQTCWPELLVEDHSTVLRSNKNTLRLAVIRENATASRSKLANIRSN